MLQIVDVNKYERMKQIAATKDKNRVKNLRIMAHNRNPAAVQAAKKSE